MNIIIALLLTLTLIFTVTGCSGGQVVSANTVTTPGLINSTGSDSGTAGDAARNSTAVQSIISAEYDNDDEYSGMNGSEISSISFAGNSITIDGPGAVVDGNKIAITSAGTYSLSGTLDDGQVIVLTKDQETVKLILNGVDITCSWSAPVYIKQAKKAVITLAEGTDNYITDGDCYDIDDSGVNEPNAAIFSKSDLTINGSGSLTVDANYNNGIQSKDGLKITGGMIAVNAVNDGIKGKDFIAVKDGIITVEAGGDGMQSDNDEDAGRGYICIEGGTLNISSGADGIQAETVLSVNGGDITIFSGGGSVNSSNKIGMNGNTWGSWGNRGEPGMQDNFAVQNNADNSSSADSAKGLKAGVAIAITGGVITIDSSDDAIHSNDGLVINGGTIVIASGDDGMHSDSTLEINGGSIRITKCYEGIESAIVIINDGTIHLVSNDDGINVVGGMDGSSINGRPGQNDFNISGDNYLCINGGYLFIDSTGDGLDINGPVTMTGGAVLINGPTANDNGALDYSGYFKITGGLLVAVGSSGMAQAPGTSSTQYSVMVGFSSAQSEGTLVHIESEGGEEIITFASAKTYQSVVVSSPDLKNGMTCVLYCGGSSTGTAIDGLYSGGMYTAGTQLTSFTISSMVTSNGISGGGMGGMMPGGGGLPPGSGRR